MSFTSDIKQEVAANKLKSHCQRAQLSALIQLTSSIKIGNKSFILKSRSESSTASKRIVYLLKELYKAEVNIQVARKTNLKKNNVFYIEIPEGKKIIEDLGLYTSRGLQSHPKYEIIMKDCCAAAYLAGCFIAYGACNDPGNSNYHLELSLPDIDVANFINKLLSRFDIEGKISKRRNRYVVYLKKADYISSFLALIKAHDAMMKFEDERIGRDVRNSVIRIDNCEIANEVKTFKAAQKQIEQIQLIIDSDKYDELDEKLKNVAEIRMKHQDYSLLEMCAAYLENYGDIISKSGMKHRLDKIELIAEKIGELK